jgi:hypothetical protein
MKKEITKDRDEVIIITRIPGQPKIIDIYLDVRAGLTWPTHNHPGYLCIVGLKDEPTLSDKKPLVLLAEGQDEPMEKLFEKLTAKVKRFYCERIFANLENNESYQQSLYKFVRNRKLDGIRLLDSSQFEEFEHNAALIKQYRRDNALEIPNGTDMRNQLRSIELDDLKQGFEERYYAIMALGRLLGSYEVYQWRRPYYGFSGFSNIVDRAGRDGWDGSYKEFHVD